MNDARAKRRTVCTALLSARMFADALEDPYLRYSGIGTVPIAEALDVLAADGRLDVGGDASSWTRWMTRYRVAGALKQQLVVPGRLTTGLARVAAALRKREPPATDLAEKVDGAFELARELDRRDRESESEREVLLATIGELRATTQGDEISGTMAGLEQAAHDQQEVARVAVATLKADLGRRIDAVGETLPELAKARLEKIDWPVDGKTGPLQWETQVHVEPGGPTTVASWLEAANVDVDDRLWRHLVIASDPRNWKRASLFWLRSDADAVTTALGRSWSGELEEVVSAVATFRAVLNVRYEVGNDQWTTRYTLARSPDGLTRDEGYVTAFRDGDRLRFEVMKRIDFADGPFGGPSSLDLLAPSYIGSWLRVQQDVWAANVVGADFEEG